MVTGRDDVPAGTTSVAGISHRRSQDPVPETVDHLRRLIDAAAATVFAVIDQRGRPRRRD